MARKVNLATEIVQRAQSMYPDYLKSAVDYIGANPPYGKKVVSPQTRDKQIARMLPQDIAALAATDPQAYMKTVERLQELQQRASTSEPLPAPDAYEGD